MRAEWYEKNRVDLRFESRNAAIHIVYIADNAVRTLQAPR